MHDTATTVRVYFTRLHTHGTLRGMHTFGSIAYPTVEGCAEFIRAGRRGFKPRPGGVGGYKIVDASFQRYER